MLDLNIHAAYSGASSPTSDEIDCHKTPTADSVASTNTSTTNNELDCNTSTLNFSILNKDVIEIEDDAGNDVVNYWNELQLFPVSVSPPSPTPAIIRANYWLNLSAPAVASDAVGGGRGVVHPPPAKKSRRGPRSRSSQYRGVTFYRRTGRWESHIWDCGKQVYLGGFDTAHAAARAYDRAAIKFRGVDADINFTISDYEEDMKLLKNLTKEEFVLVLRRQSNGSARGNSKYRGLNLHKYGRWEAQMGQFSGKNAYDKAAINCNGREALTNFELSNYDKEMNISSGNGGNNSCLDLSLGISLSSDGSKGNSTTRNMQFPHGNRSKMEPNSAPPQELVPTKYPPTWAGIYSCFGPNSKELRMSGEAVSSPGFSLNWPWKMPVLASSAASSGFSPATSPYMASVAPFTSQRQLS